MSDIVVPKIDLDVKNNPANEPKTGDSILLPNSENPTVISEISSNDPVAIPEDPPMKDFKKSKLAKVLLGVGIFIVVFIAAIAVPGFLVYQKGSALVSESKKLSQVAKSKDINQVKAAITSEKKSLQDFKSTFALLSWTRIIPYFGGYTSDALHAINAAQAGLDASQIVISASEPYLDTLGFFSSNNNSQKDGTKTTQERIDFVIKAIPALVPQMDQISEKTSIVKSEIDQINADRYPDKFKGYPIKSSIKSAQEVVDEASVFITNGKAVLQDAPYLLGVDSPRTYLLLFQNDKELRPTGGFMTGYAIMKVDKAKFEPVSSNDIYNLDAQYIPSIPAPDPIVKYIKGPYVLSQNLRFRDMNWSPDFAVSMGTVTTAAKTVGITNIDGIIAVDTQLLVNLLDVIGPIGVSGFGNFSTAIDPQCNCAQVIHELESFADIEGPVIWDPVTGKIILSPPNSDNRKRIIGPLMNSILANALGQPKDKLPALFQAGFKSLMEKHVLFYLTDNKVEKAVADFGIGGTIKEYQGDYLHINDANLGGRKSNLYVTQEVQQDISVASDGSVEKTVTITYKNPQKQDGWLNSILPDWVRIYVPKGSTLVASEGLEAKQDPYEELGKTVFAGYFQLRPEGVSKVTFKYKLPFKVSRNYQMLIQKQPGTDGPLYTINLGRHTEEFYLKTDKELKIGL